MPGTVTSQSQQSDYWAMLSHLRWRDKNFNLLGEGNIKHDKGPQDKWQDNRIGYFKDCTLRYDLFGNRTEQLSFKKDEKEQYNRQRYGYDGAHQLTDVKVAQVVGRGQVVTTTECRYVHDALGRRLKKIIKAPDGKEQITYFGWDGDQLVHIETPQEDGSRKIEHIIYEPGTFTPMVRLTTRDNSKRKGRPSLIELSNLAGRPPEQRNSPELAKEQEILRKTLEITYPPHRKQLEKQMRQAIEEGPTEQTRSVMRELGIDPVAWRKELRQSLEEIKKSDVPVEIHFYHCDHLGTPIALTDQQGNIVWAARFDPFGNLLEEYNPNNIEQNIRLPGQYHDRETNLYYNRFRYYDPKIGSYINQDPIGLKGGNNLFMYARNPLKSIDPLGLMGIGDAYKSIKYFYDTVTGIKAANKRACLAEHIIRRKQARKELEAKLGHSSYDSSYSMTSWDNNALQYLEDQKEADTDMSMQIAAESGKSIYDMVPPTPANVIATGAELITSVPNGYDTSAHAPGRGQWYVALTCECDQ